MTYKFEKTGLWFLPENPDVRLPGTLKFDPIEGAYLDLIGSFSNEIIITHKNTEQDIILGITSDTKLITLKLCFRVSSSGISLQRGRETGVPTITYYANYTFVGAHLSSEDQFKFNQISTQIQNLDEWVGISGFIRDDKEFERIQNHEILVNYKLPENIDFEIDKTCSGQFSFSANHPAEWYYNKSKEITQKVYFKISSPEGLKLNPVLQYITKFQNFLILALYRSIQPISIELVNNNIVDEFYSHPLNIELFYKITRKKTTEKPKVAIEMIFSYPIIKDQFDVLIKNWFEKYNLLEPAFDLLFEQFYDDEVFKIHNFLNLAQAAESFHSRLHSHTKMPKDEYEMMKKTILDSSPTKYHKWLKDQFNFGNNLNLQTRLEELMDHYSVSLIKEIIPDKKGFILKVKHSRNYYTHYSSSSKKNAAKGFELLQLSQKLKLLMVAAFLTEIGFTKDKVDHFFTNVRWKLFNHLIDVK